MDFLLDNQIKEIEQLIENCKNEKSIISIEVKDSDLLWKNIK